MKVSIPVEFIVTTEEDGELFEDVAEVAAEQAAFDFLAFVKVSGYGSSVESVNVHVDGFGKCKVAIAED